MFKTSVKIEGQTFAVTFPNAGQIIDIWNNQMMLSNNRYAEMAQQQTRLSNFMVDAIDTIATFTVLIPELGKQLNAKAFTDLEPKKLKMLVAVYRKQFYPWYGEILRDLLTDEPVVELDVDDKEDADTDSE
jgi:glutamate/tyrosine decarboxylase-like PLP-dependent enzyme